ncbi:hypothetical protein [Pseudomonas sp.]|uniref:hypothetical protein n=1 Tax=Pseudomonas sp. TaxID=306 RepID=UPI003D0C3855
MRAPWRITLIWLLMLALPAQAMAASVMQACHAVAPSAAASLVAHHGGQHETASASHHGNHQPDQQTPSAGTCSLCAGCVGAAVLNSTASRFSPWQANGPSRAALVHFDGFIADTPERPPRPSLL